MQIFKLSIVKFLFLLLFLSIISCASNESGVNEEETEDGVALNQEEDFGLKEETPQKEIAPYSKTIKQQKHTALDYKKVNESLLKKINYDYVDLNVAEKNNNFVLDTLINYKGIPVVILRVKSPDEYKIDRSNDINVADKYLITRKTDKKDIKDIFLIQEHKTLLDSFINTTKGSNKVLILMYSRSTPVKNYHKDIFKVNRAKYQQAVLIYLYSKLKNVRIEQRFLDNLPDDEIFLTAFNYEGSFSNNVYSVPKASGLDWLQAFLNYQAELLGVSNINKTELEKSLLKTSEPANKTKTQNKLQTPR